MSSFENPGTDLTYKGYRPGSIRPAPESDGKIFEWNQSPFWSRTHGNEGTAYAMSVGLIKRLVSERVTHVEVEGERVELGEVMAGELITPDDELFEGKESPDEAQRIIVV